MPDHHPPHFFIDDAWYFISASTFEYKRLLNSTASKQLFQDQLLHLITAYKLRLAAWVILDNHYHLLVKISIGSQIPEIIRKLHGRVSHDVNQLEGILHRKFWQNYWDSCIKDENDFWTHFNYIHQNPVKHGYVREMSEWQYSSYHHYLKTKGEDWLMDAFLSYPIIDFHSARDEK